MLYFSDPLNQQQYQCAQTIKPTQGSGEIISYMLVFEKYGKRLKSLKIPAQYKQKSLFKEKQTSLAKLSLMLDSNTLKKNMHHQ